MSTIVIDICTSFSGTDGGGIHQRREPVKKSPVVTDETVFTCVHDPLLKKL